MTRPTDELVFIDSRCAIKLKQDDLTVDPLTLELWENAKTHLGTLNFDASGQKIVIKSMRFCKNETSFCTKEFPYDTGTDKEGLQCKITFAGSTWSQKETTLLCESSSKKEELNLTDDEGVLTVIGRVKYIKLNRIWSYNLHCPGDRLL